MNDATDSSTQLLKLPAENDGMFLLGRDLVATSESLAAESGKQLSLFAA